MRRNEHPVDDFFESELGDYSIAPPEAVWSAINNRLEKKKSIKVLFIRLGFAAGIALFTGISGVMYFTGNKSNEVQISDVAGNNNTIKVQSQLNIQGSINVQSNIQNTNHQEEINTANKSLVNKKEEPNFSNKSVENKIASLHSTSATVADVNKSAATDNVNTNHESSDRLAVLSAKQGNIKLDGENPNVLSIDDIHLTEGNLSVVSPVTNEEIAYEPVPNTNKPWSIETAFAPSYSYRTVESGAQGNAQLSQYNGNESGLFAWSGGVKLNYKRSKRFSIQFGLYYSQMGQILNNYFEKNTDLEGFATMAYDKNSEIVDNSFGAIASDENPVVPDNSPGSKLSGGEYYNTLPSSTNNLSYSKLDLPENKTYDGDLIQQLKFIEIPIMARYTLLSGKFNFHVIGGFSSGILFNSNVYINDNGTKTKFGKTTNLNAFNYSALGGIGVTFPVRKNISIILEPVFKYNLNPLSRSGSVKTHLYSYSLYTGISFSL